MFGLAQFHVGTTGTFPKRKDVYPIHFYGHPAFFRNRNQAFFKNKNQAFVKPDKKDEPPKPEHPVDGKPKNQTDPQPVYDGNNSQPDTQSIDDDNNNNNKKNKKKFSLNLLDVFKLLETADPSLNTIPQSRMWRWFG